MNYKQNEKSMENQVNWKIKFQSIHPKTGT